MATPHFGPLTMSKVVRCLGMVALILPLFTTGFPIRVGHKNSSGPTEYYPGKPIHEDKKSQSAALWFYGNRNKSAGSQLGAKNNESGFMMPPIWFHIAGKGNNDKMLNHQARGNAERNLQHQLTSRDKSILNDLYQQAIQR